MYGTTGVLHRRSDRLPHSNHPLPFKSGIPNILPIFLKFPHQFVKFLLLLPVFATHALADACARHCRSLQERDRLDTFWLRVVKLFAWDPRTLLALACFI